MQKVNPFISAAALSDFSDGVQLKKTRYKSFTHTATPKIKTSGKYKMDSSTMTLLSEEELVEIAARMLAGEYKTIKGFTQDLAAFLLNTEKPALSRVNNNIGEVIFVSEIHRIESIITGEAWRKTPGLRSGRWH